MAIDKWAERDLVVLDHLVEHFDDVNAYRVTPEVVAEAVGLQVEQVQRAFKHLYEASPPYVRIMESAQLPYPTFITEVTERARRAVGQWPTPESWADSMTTALRDAAEAEPDPEKKSRLKQAASVLGGIGREIIIRTATGKISGEL